MADWKDILSDDERPLSDGELLQYINAQTLAVDKQQIKDIATDVFEKDALEGLQKLKSPGDTPKHVAKLKQQLKKQLSSNKKQRNQRTKNKDMQWILFAVILLLITCVLAYFIIKMGGNSRSGKLMWNKNFGNDFSYRM